MNPVTTRFTYIELTPEEEKQGYVFTHLNAAVIQRQIAIAALEKSSLQVDPNNIMNFVQAEARLDGAIRALEALLAFAEVDAASAPAHVQSSSTQP